MMRAFAIVCTLSLGCLPVGGDVSQLYDSQRQARQNRCDDEQAGGGAWCEAIDGACYGARVAPTMSPAEGTAKPRYGHTSMCLAPPTEGECYLGYQRMQALRNDGTDVYHEVCAPKPLCKGPADCAEPGYGFTYGSTFCAGQDPVCRFQRGDRCDSDAECVDRHGDGSLCFQNYCESTNPDAVAACDDEELFTGRCKQAVDPPPAIPTHFNDDAGLLSACSLADGECSVTVGLVGACRELFPDRFYCLPVVAGRAPCPAGWVKDTTQNPAVCVPMIPCKGFGVINTDPQRGGGGWCGSRRNESACESGNNLQVLGNVPPCSDEQPCPDGSSCFRDLCVVPESSTERADNQVTIPVCNQRG